AANMRPERDANRNTMQGWDTSITAYPTNRFGVTADFSGFYGSLNPTITSSTGATTTLSSVDLRQYSFLGGPQVRLFRTKHFNTSVRALFGASHGYVVDNNLSALGYKVPDDTQFAALFGTNFDVNVSKKTALRFSPGLYLTQFNGETQKNFRFSVGPVFKFR